MVRQQKNDTGMHDSGYGRWVGLAMLSLGVSMIIVDATVVNVATPAIINDLKLDSTITEWVNTTYALVFAALLITMGRLGDAFGRRRILLTGLVVFMLASVQAGFASSGTVLIVARILQGVGGAMMMPTSTSIVNTNFRGKDRAVAFGIWGATIGGMAAVGPLLGGYLTTYASWRWAFYVNVPIGIFALAGIVQYIGESKDDEARRGFDLPGFILITAGLASFVFGLIEGRNYGWWMARQPFTMLGLDLSLGSISVIPVALVLGLAALALFTRIELQRKASGRFYLFDFSLWRNRAFRYGNLAGTIVSLGEFGLLFALPLFLQAVLGFTAFRTGLTFLSLALGSFVAAGAAAPISKLRGPRSVVRLGMALEVIGIAGTTALISRDTTIWSLATPMFIYGMGVGFASAQLASIVLADVPVGSSGLASGANSTLRQVGSGLGIAILGTVLFSSLTTTGASNLQARLPQVSATCRAAISTLVDETAGQVLPALRQPASRASTQSVGSSGLPPEQGQCFRDPSFIAALPAAVAPIEDAYVTATRVMGVTAALFVLLGLVFSLLLPPDRRAAEPEKALRAAQTA